MGLFKEFYLREQDEFARLRLAQQANLRYVGWGHYKDSSGKSFDWDEQSSKFVPIDVSKEVHGKVGRESSSNSSFRHTYNVKDVVELSKTHKDQVYFLEYDDKYNKTYSFYLKNGKFAKYTVANSNYDFANNQVKPKFPKDGDGTEYKFSVSKN